MYIVHFVFYKKSYKFTFYFEPLLNYFRNEIMGHLHLRTSDGGFIVLQLSKQILIYFFII